MNSMCEPPRTICLTLAYDGTSFSGWQRQTNERTVQGVLEAALARLHGQPVSVNGAGRTDSGVHAAGQAASFHTTIARIPAERFVPALNGFLPQDVRVLAAREERPSFHARFDAKSRTYRYFMLTSQPFLPHKTRFALPLWRQPDMRLLSSYARLLRGEMDCSFFASPADPSFSRGSGSHFRFIHNAAFYAEDSALVFEIQANAFLWKMVRTIVGTFLLFAERGVSVTELQRLIIEGNRAKAGPASPPQALFLWSVSY